MPEDCDRIAQLEARVLRLEHALNRLSGANECNREDLWDNIWSSFIFPSPDSGKAGDW